MNERKTKLRLHDFVLWARDVLQNSKDQQVARLELSWLERTSNELQIQLNKMFGLALSFAWMSRLAIDRNEMFNEHRFVLLLREASSRLLFRANLLQILATMFVNWSFVSSARAYVHDSCQSFLGFVFVPKGWRDLLRIICCILCLNLEASFKPFSNLNQRHFKSL